MHRVRKWAKNGTNRLAWFRVAINLPICQTNKTLYLHINTSKMACAYTVWAVSTSKLQQMQILQRQMQISLRTGHTFCLQPSTGADFCRAHFGSNVLTPVSSWSSGFRVRSTWTQILVPPYITYMSLTNFVGMRQKMPLFRVLWELEEMLSSKLVPKVGCWIPNLW